MVTHIFSLASTFPELFARSVKPVRDLPVFYDGRRVSTASLNPNGEFPIMLPADIETKTLGKTHLRFYPIYEELNRNTDPSKIRLRITGIRVTLSHR